MLQSLVASWGRLVSGGAPGPTTELQEHERRVWVRHPCDLEAICQTAGAPESKAVAARVRNLSRGGVNLLLQQRFEPGTLLSVVLPTANDGSSCTVLACVLYCSGQTSGEWALGCTFAAELNDEDLLAFGAQRQRPAEPDSRGWVRYPCSAPASYQLVQANDGMRWPAQVVDISANGVALVVNRPVDAGMLLDLELGHGGPGALNMLASAVRVSSEPGKAWKIGCNFIRTLNDQELRRLLCSGLDTI